MHRGQEDEEENQKKLTGRQEGERITRNGEPKITSGSDTACNPEQLMRVKSECGGEILGMRALKFFRGVCCKQDKKNGARQLY